MMKWLRLQLYSSSFIYFNICNLYKEFEEKNESIQERNKNKWKKNSMRVKYEMKIKISLHYK